MIKKKYRANKPELKKNCEIVGLFASNLQVTIFRVSISVLKGRPKRKIRPIYKDFCDPVGPFYFLSFLILF